MAYDNRDPISRTYFELPPEGGCISFLASWAVEHGLRRARETSGSTVWRQKARWASL
jgi:hypothetical protein